VDFFLFYEDTFFDILILKIPSHELFMRTINLGLFVLFGLMMAKVVSKQGKITGELHQFEHIVSSSTDMMALLGKQFKYLAVNKAYVDAFNLTKTKLIGQTVSEMFGEEFFKTTIKPHVEKCLSGEEINYQAWMEFPAYGKRYMDVTYSPYLSKNNEVIGFVVNARNITERKKAEEELQNIFNLSPDMVAVCTTEGKFLKVNPSWEKILGYTEKELLDLGWTKLVHPDDVERTNKEVEKQLLGSSVVNFINRYKCKDGSYKTLEWQATFDSEGIVYGTARDIPKRKISEKELKRSQEKLHKLSAHLQNVREEERTLVAHELHDDIGQALSALKMDIYMLKKKFPKDQKDISDLFKETDDLLDKTIQTTRRIYSELRPALLEHFGIKEVIEDQLKTFKESTGISGESEIDLEVTELDKKYSIILFRIVQEALTNIKWHSHAKTVKIRLKKKKNQIEMTIRDNGIGIKEDDLTKSNSFGTMGMKERAEFLGGEIEFKGIPDKGTTVTVTFPLDTKSD